MLFLVALLVVGLTSLFFVWKKRRDARALLEKPKTDEERRAEAQKVLATPPPRPSSVFSRGEEESSLVKTKRKAKPSSKFHEDDFEEEEDVGYEPTEIVRLLKEDDDEAITETASHHPNWFERDIEVIRELELYLIRAIENDKVKVIEALINKKILLLDAVLEGTQNRKRGLVGWAASVQSPKVMEYLILRGSPIDLDGDDDTIFREAPTVIAASHGNANQLETLLRHGANPNYVDCRGESALQRACRLGDLRSCEALIKYEADVNRPNGNGTFAIERAASGPYPEVVETLLKAGSYCPLFAADPSAVDTVTNLIVDRMIEASRVAVSVHIPLSMISFVATAPLDVVKNINQKFSLRFYQLTQGSSSSRKSLIPFKSKKALRVEIADDLFSNVNICDTETLVPDNLWIHNTGALKIECIVHREANPGGLPFESTIPLESPPRLVLDKHSKSKITLCLSPKTEEVVETALMLEINGASAKLGKANHRWIHWVKVFPARQKSHKPRRVDQIVAQCELKK